MVSTACGGSGRAGRGWRNLDNPAPKNNRQKRLRTRSLVKSSALSEVSAVEFQKGVTMTAGNASAFFGSVPRFQERLVFGSLVFVTAGNEI